MSDGSGIKVILETEAEPNVMEIETGESSLLERMATHFGFKLDALSCKVKARVQSVPVLYGRLSYPLCPGLKRHWYDQQGMKPSTLLAPRTICQIPAVPNRHVVIPRGTVVHDIVSKRMYSTVNFGLSMLRRIR